MIAQIKEAFTTLVVSMFSKKFVAFIVLAWTLAQEKQWEALLGAFVAYITSEVVDKKTTTVPQPKTSEEPISPEATPEPTDETVVVEEQ